MIARRYEVKRVVVALFKDDQDIALWSPYFSRISAPLHLLRIEDLAQTLASLRGRDPVPPLFVISTRLYPHASPRLVEDIRGWFPGSEFLLLASGSDTFPALQPLVRDNVRHLVINPEGTQLVNVARESAQLCTAVSKLIEGRPLNISDYLKPGTETFQFRVSSSEQKEELISGLEELISGDGPEMELLRHKGALLVDEMFENALYGAPHRENGASIYAKGQVRQIDARETIILRYGFDGECIAMEMEDNWGSLSPDAVLECLAANHDSHEFREEQGGRGLFIIWRFLDHLHVHIDPGRQTVVGGQVRLLTAENLVEKKGFHITTGSAV